jgi:hypothetical protein
MLWFGRNRKAANAIAEQINGILFVATNELFVDSEGQFRTPDRKLRVPDVFWEDFYLIGFFHSLMTRMIIFLCGESLSLLKYGEIMQHCSKKICGDALQAVEAATNELDKENPNTEFSRGRADGIMYFEAHMDTLDPNIERLALSEPTDAQHPTLLKAQELTKQSLRMGIGYSQLLGSIQILTVNAHIKKRYLNTV